MIFRALELVASQGFIGMVTSAPSPELVQSRSLSPSLSFSQFNDTPLMTPQSKHSQVYLLLPIEGGR